MSSTSATPHLSDPITESQSAKTTPMAPVKEQMNTVGEELRQLGRVGRDAAKQELAVVRQRGEEVVEGTKERVGEWEQSLARRVRQQPMQSVLYAAGAGVLLGFLLRR